MRRNISTQDLKIHIGEVVDAVRLRGDGYIIERRGKPVAAIVPVSVNENDERVRRRFFELGQTVRQRNVDASSEEVDAAIEKAISEVRKRKRSARS